MVRGCSTRQRKSHARVLRALLALEVGTKIDRRQLVIKQPGLPRVKDSAIVHQWFAFRPFFPIL